MAKKAAIAKPPAVKRVGRVQAKATPPSVKRANSYSDNKIRLGEDVLAIADGIAKRFGFESARPVIEAIFRSQVAAWRSSANGETIPIPESKAKGKPTGKPTGKKPATKRAKPHEGKIRIAPDVLDQAIEISTDLGLNSHRAVIEAVIRSRHQEWLKSFAQSAA